MFVNATNGAGALAALQAVGSALDGKVVIDTSNPLDYSQGFPPTLFVSNTDSLAEQLQAALPQARLVKMFNTMANEVMTNPGGLSQESTIFVAGNDDAARQTAAGSGGGSGLDRRLRPGRSDRGARPGDVDAVVDPALRPARPSHVQPQARPLTRWARASDCA